MVDFEGKGEAKSGWWVILHQIIFAPCPRWKILVQSWSLIYSASRRRVKSWKFLHRCLWPIKKKGQAADRYSTLRFEGHFTKSIFLFISGLHCPLMKQEGSSSTIDPWRRRRVALMGLRLALVSQLSGQQAISRRDQGSRIWISMDWGSSHSSEYQGSRIGEDWGSGHNEYQRSWIGISEDWGWNHNEHQG